MKYTYGYNIHTQLEVFPFPAKFKHAPPTINSREMVSQISKNTINSVETPPLTPIQMYFIIFNYCCLVAKSCPALCEPKDYSPPGSSVHGMSQARILEWVAISYSRVGFQGGASGKESTPPMQDTRVQFLGREDPLERDMATHSNIVSWDIPWTEEPGRL